MKAGVNYLTEIISISQSYNVMKYKMFITTLLLSFFAMSSYAQCGSNKTSVLSAYQEKGNDIIDIASNDKRFSTLVVAIKTAGLVETLKGEGPFTVFAPTNDAFDKLPKGTVASLLEPASKDVLAKILTYHVVAGKVMAKDVVAAITTGKGSFSIQTVSGNKLTASLKGENVILTDENGGVSTIVITDIDASNGVIHVIDSVVLPK